jgi:hypothetical protein
MACNDEVTVLERQLPSGIDASSTAMRGDESNLYAQIDRDKVYGLNLSDPSAAAVCIKPWDRRSDMATWTESGVDDQFIVNVLFISPVRLKSILVNVGRGDFAPQRLRAFVNRPDGVDFADLDRAEGPSRASTGPANSGKPQADVALQEGATGVVEYPVSISRFQNTTNVSLVFSDAPSQSLSRVYYLGFRGTALQLAKEAGEHFDVPAANAAEKPIDGVREKSQQANWAR